MCISIIGSFIGNVYLKIIVKKYDKPSILIWILAILLLTSGVVLLLTGLGKIFTESNLFKFGYPC